ncbi:MAG: hypothetical protein ACE5JG_13320, partial [Planctomycetota bacterium]
GRDDLMSEEFEPLQRPAPESGEPRNLAAEYRKLPPAERWLAVIALVVLLAWVFQRGWEGMGRWYETLCLFGSAIVLVLVATRLYGVQVLRTSVDTTILFFAALLPAAGYVVDQLRELTLWGFVLLAGAVLMAYVGVRISTREKLLKRP